VSYCQIIELNSVFLEIIHVVSLDFSALSISGIQRILGQL